MNGFQLSDAYETHNMGLRYETEDYYALIDLGIVSPDMYVYRNEYREANRSFGELITLELGQPTGVSGSHSYYARIKSVGEFGIDEMQDFAHRILSLQPVNEVNDLVRMTGDTWVGIGLRSSYHTNLWFIRDATLSYDAYIGTDAGSIQVDATKAVFGSYFDYSVSTGLNAVLYDEVVSAAPVLASTRHLVPYANVRVEFDAFGYDFYVSERISLPTIATDDRVFAVLSAGITFDF